MPEQPQCSSDSGLPQARSVQPPDGAWGKKLFLGVLASIFVCPGVGHRIMGRHTAYKSILIAFFGTFLVLAVSFYSLVQGLVQEVASRGTIQLPDLINAVSKSLGNASLAAACLGILGIIYVGAPIELVVTELIRRYS